MKVVRLTLSLTLAVFLMTTAIHAQEMNTDASATGQICYECQDARICPKDCKHCQYLAQRNGAYCPTHGYGNCPKRGLGIGQALRNVGNTLFGDCPRSHGYNQAGSNAHYSGPYAGGYGYGQAGYDGYGGYGGYGHRRPLQSLHTWLYGPYPQNMEPVPTYTTRSPRDFLAPNPPSIGY